MSERRIETVISYSHFYGYKAVATTGKYKTSHGLTRKDLTCKNLWHKKRTVTQVRQLHSDWQSKFAYKDM